MFAERTSDTIVSLNTWYHVAGVYNASAQTLDIYVNGAPCPMCMSAIYWSRIDRVFFGNSLKDTSKIGFDDAFQYEDFAKPWSERHIPIAENFERDMTMKSYKAWMDKEDRHPY